MTNLRYLVFVACAVVVTSCQTPRLSLPTPAGSAANEALSSEELKAALQRSWSRQQHVAGLAYRLGLRNAELCGEGTTKDLGIEWITLADLPQGNPRVAGTMLGVESLPFVAVATPGSPADRAGIRQGDTLLSVNGKPLPAAADEYYTYIVVNNVELPRYRRRVDRMLAQAVESGLPVEIAIRRDGEEISTSVRPEDVCDYNVLLVEDSDLGIAGEGKTVLMSSGLYDFAASDAEIQVAIAHQLAHIAERHGAEKTRNSLIGGLLGGAAALYVVAPVAVAGVLGAGMSGGEIEGDVEGLGSVVEGSGRFFSRLGGGMFALSREREADYVALYMLERSGVSAAEAVAFWRRVPADAPLARTHAGMEERLENMDATVREIGRKRTVGAPLVPNENRSPVAGKD